MDTEELNTEIRKCSKCRLCETRTNALCGEGNLTALSRSEFPEVYGRFFWTGVRKILPLPHPAVLLYDASVKKELIEKYRKMRVLLEDCEWYPMCPLRRFYEKGELSREWIELYCRGDWESCIRYKMEERGEPHPDWMLPDGSIDEKLQESYGRC